MSEIIKLAIILLVYMTIWFIVSLIKKRNDVADIAWGLGFVLLCWSSYFLNGFTNITGLIVNTLVTIWGVRLSWHIFLRNSKRGEDERYLAWRNSWGKWFVLRSFFQIFILQGFLLFLIIQPVLFINQQNSSGFELSLFIGLVVWIIGFAFESIGDYQLKQFIKNPENKGKIIQSGLWKYSRHPNYFGEVTMWWGIFIVTLGYSNGILTLIGPVTITLLIFFVSGIPMLEKKYENRAEYIEYKKRTSIFIPLPPKSE
jgi:steroid 5-alpha reductase family enzyme